MANCSSGWGCNPLLPPVRPREDEITGVPGLVAKAHGSHPVSNARTLTSAIRSGDEAAFERFYEAYCDRLYRAFFVLTGEDAGLAQELLQVVMIKAARKLPIIETEAQLWAWLVQVGRRAFLDELRRRKRSASLQPTEVSDPLGQSEGLSKHSAYGAWLEDAVNELKEKDRQLLEYFYAEGQSQKQIAIACRKTSKAIESRLARIRTALRNALLRRKKDEEF